MPTQTLVAKLQGLLRGRHIATLATENADGSIHLTAVWYLSLGVPALRNSARPALPNQPPHTLLIEV